MNKNRYTLRWVETNPRHTRFAVYDRTGANCGFITVLTSDARNFVAYNWDGNVDWLDALSREHALAKLI